MSGLIQVAQRAALIAAIAIATIAGLSQTARANNLSDDVATELGAMKTVYSAYYAPAAWKKQYAGYDLGTEYAKALAAATSTKSPLTMKQARVIFRDFIYAMKDYHTSISFVSTEQATLPIVARGAEGRLFLVSIDRTKLSEVAFPFAVGDELLTVDGVSATTVVDGLQKTFISNADATDRAEAEMRLFARRASRGFTDIPQGPVTLGLRRAGETAISYVQLLWDYTPEKITPRTDFFSARIQQPRGSIFNPQMSIDFDAADSTTPYDLGSRVSFMPALGTKIWQSAADSTFDAYIFQNDDHKLIGYIRIPSYEPADAAAAVKEFSDTIARMQSITDSLVIDQVNNPGGSVFYLYALAGMLTDSPLSTPRHRMAIAQADVVNALNTLETLKDIKNEDDLAKAKGDDFDFGGYPASYELVVFSRAYAQFIVDQWSQGHKLTDPYWIGGVDHINPNAVHYSKPILLLINELDFSGGDFFPTIMQDNKRVTVMGTRTAGAGGYVNDVSLPNNVGVASFRVTQSIAERVSGNPIENLGVTPDVNYSMTALDYTSNFAPYVKAVKAAIQKNTP